MSSTQQTGFKQQTKALVRKSWSYQKRNVGTNVCLCVAPVFFCVVLALIQVAVNVAFLSTDNFKCGCLCEQCCPDWALVSSPNNFTAYGNGTITISNPQVWGNKLAMFPPSSIISNTSTELTINTCMRMGSGACPTEFDYTCLQKNEDVCGIQFSTTQQAQWCAVPQPSVWPPVWQTPSDDRRAKPWGEPPVPRPATLVTAQDPSLLSSLQGEQLLFPGLTTDPLTLLSAYNRLYSGNASDPSQGNVYNGDQLSVMGFQFGTDADPQGSLYIERSFTPGENLFVLVNNNVCVSKGIPANTSICMGRFLQLYYNSSALSIGTLAGEQDLAWACAPGARGINTNTSRLLDMLSLQVICTENAVVGTATPHQLDDMLYCGYYQARCNLSNPVNNNYQAGIDLQDSASGKLNLNVLYNETLQIRNAGPDRLARVPGSISTAVTAWWKYVMQSADAQGMQLLGIMGMPKVETKLKLDFSSLLGPLFYCWVVQLLLPTFLQQLVYEKEKRLRMMMKMHGLGDAAYWAITYLWYLMLYVVYIIIFIVIGAICQLKMFIKTNIGIQIIFYFLFGNCMIAFAFMLSSLFSSSRTAVVVAFLYVFATGLIGELLLKNFMDENKMWLFFVEWVPAWALYRGLYEMSTYTFFGIYKNESGLTFAKLSDDGNGMLATWGIFVVEWALFLIVGLYLEQVVSSGTGIRRRPLFFLNWIWRKKEVPTRVSHDGAGHGRGSLDVKVHALDMTHSSHSHGITDVEAERKRVMALESYEDNPIVMKDLKKVYPGLDGGKPKTAVRSLTLGIQRGECFGLLGPNGAGKTTSINMLVGFLEPSGGTGIVEGYNISTDMRHIYKLMGVCPQHDLLWEQLSGREHLRFYGTLKGLNGQELEDAIDAALRAVNLYNAGVGDKQAGKYSGGMKRRLSVAISFIGSPKVVYLDEPSTGLDPASRRNLWEVVKSSKRGRSIILTTHSMEEAEQLCDRLGIFVDGQLVCIGAPKEITSRYAGFYVFTISVPVAQESEARALVLRLSPNAVLTYALGGTLKYELPSAEVSLSGVFKAVNEAKAHGLSIIDWGVANATLEEVFIKLAKTVGATSNDS